MVGGYSNADGSSGGFLLRNGNFSLFNYPGGTFTNPRGINDADIIVGNAYVKHNTAAVSFLYDGNAFTTIRAPGKSATIANGINNAGTIVGGDGTLGTTVGFELVGSKFESFSPPPHNYIYVYGTGVNNVGELVGWTAGAAPNGFARQSGKYKTVTFPASSMTEVWGVNDNGVIVGWYTQNESPYDSFGFAFIQGTYISLSYPGAINTFGFGINAAGQIVGTYTLDNSTYHGFVTSPIAAAEMAGQ
jgi:probable HAF family extracellular repeat protein